MIDGALHPSPPCHKEPVLSASSTLRRVPRAAVLGARRFGRALIDPDALLYMTWIVAGCLIFWFAGFTAGTVYVLAGVTVMFVLMCSVAAFLPPAPRLRKRSLLNVRLFELLKLASGAALFGAAAAYSGAVGSLVSDLPEEDRLAPETIWIIILPILFIATVIGGAYVGVRMAVDLRTAGERRILLALGRARSHFFRPQHRIRPLVSWLAHLAVSASRGGAFVIVGALSPFAAWTGVYLFLQHFFPDFPLL